MEPEPPIVRLGAKTPCFQGKLMLLLPPGSVASRPALGTGERRCRHAGAVIRGRLRPVRGWAPQVSTSHSDGGFSLSFPLSPSLEQRPPRPSNTHNTTSNTLCRQQSPSSKAQGPAAVERGAGPGAAAHTAACRLRRLYSGPAWPTGGVAAQTTAGDCLCAAGRPPGKVWRVQEEEAD